MQHYRVDFKPLNEADLPLLLEWLQRPHLSAWYAGETSTDEVSENYLQKNDPVKDDAHPFIAYLEQQPVGYVQYDKVAPIVTPDDPAILMILHGGNACRSILGGGR